MSETYPIGARRHAAASGPCTPFPTECRVLRVYIAKITFTTLIDHFTSLDAESSLVLSDQLIKLELLTQSIRQRGCQKIFAWKTLRDTSLFTLSIQPYYNITESARQSKFKRRLTILFTSGILILHFKVIFRNENRFRKGRYCIWETEILIRH